ncbi:hypothetical protein SCOR_27530 [Sulfidibacter corallicola]|uniref:Uncharacterized protein n=1 Tax=Sulfidibacter corallicola TaxID=2818388 RepID=A0A8A4TP64_SULCO|nr:hypothetical protein [Sulfidibacter corallicola]QTD50691.1 hypothetical protein J3U87_34325 [Sulfidibacter corallicola]
MSDDHSANAKERIRDALYDLNHTIGEEIQGLLSLLVTGPTPKQKKPWFWCKHRPQCKDRNKTKGERAGKQERSKGKGSTKSEPQFFPRDPARPRERITFFQYDSGPDREPER